MPINTRLLMPNIEKLLSQLMREKENYFDLARQALAEHYHTLQPKLRKIRGLPEDGSMPRIGELISGKYNSISYNQLHDISCSMVTENAFNCWIKEDHSNEYRLNLISVVQIDYLLFYIQKCHYTLQNEKIIPLFELMNEEDDFQWKKGKNASYHNISALQALIGKVVDAEQPLDAKRWEEYRTLRKWQRLYSYTSIALLPLISAYIFMLDSNEMFVLSLLLASAFSAQIKGVLLADMTPPKTDTILKSLSNVQTAQINADEYLQQETRVMKKVYERQDVPKNINNYSSVYFSSWKQNLTIRDAFKKMNVLSIAKNIFYDDEAVSASFARGDGSPLLTQSIFSPTTKKMLINLSVVWKGKGQESDTLSYDSMTLSWGNFETISLPIPKETRGRSDECKFENFSILVPVVNSFEGVKIGVNFTAYSPTVTEYHRDLKGNTVPVKRPIETGVLKVSVDNLSTFPLQEGHRYQMMISSDPISDISFNVRLEALGLIEESKSTHKLNRKEAFDSISEILLPPLGDLLVEINQFEALSCYLSEQQGKPLSSEMYKSKPLSASAFDTVIKKHLSKFVLNLSPVKLKNIRLESNCPSDFLTYLISEELNLASFITKLFKEEAPTQTNEMINKLTMSVIGALTETIPDMLERESVLYQKS